MAQRWSLILLSAGLLALATAPLSALAGGGKAPPKTIEDPSGVFSDRAKEEANAQIAQIKSKYKKDLAIETIKDVQLPASIDRKDPKAVSQFFDKFADEHAKNRAVDGIYVVFVQNQGKLRVVAGTETRKALFTPSHCRELAQKMAPLLGGDQAKKDAALALATDFVSKTLHETYRPVAQPGRETPRGGAAPAPARHDEPIPWGR